MNNLNTFQTNIAFYIETIHLICSGKQMTGFYMKCKTGLKCIKRTQIQILTGQFISKNCYSISNFNKTFNYFKDTFYEFCLLFKISLITKHPRNVHSLCHCANQNTVSNSDHNTQVNSLINIVDFCRFQDFVVVLPLLKTHKTMKGALTRTGDYIRPFSSP